MPTVTLTDPIVGNPDNLTTDPVVTGGGGEGGGESELSAEERELLNATTDLIRQQIESLARNNALMAELAPQHADFFRNQTQLAIQQVQSQIRLLPMQERVFTSVLDNLNTFVEGLGFQGTTAGAGPGLVDAPPGFQRIAAVGPGEALTQAQAALRPAIGKALLAGQQGNTQPAQQFVDAFTAAGLAPPTVEQAQGYANGTLNLPPEVAQQYVTAAVNAGLITAPTQNAAYYVGPDGTRYDTAEAAYQAAGLPLPETPQSLQDLSEDTIRRFLEGDLESLTPEQQAHIETVYSEARRRGTEEIQQFAEEQAAGRGLRLTDTPIGQESLRAKTDLEERLQAGQAATTLDYETANRNFLRDIATEQQRLGQNAAQFSQSLRLAAETARGNIAQAITGGQGGGGVNLPGMDASGLVGGLSSLLGNFQQGRQEQARLAQQASEADRRFALDDYRFRNPAPARPRDFVDYVNAFGPLVTGALGAYSAGAGR